MAAEARLAEIEAGERLVVSALSVTVDDEQRLTVPRDEK